MASEAKLVINRSPPDPGKAGKLTQAAADNEVVAAQIVERRKQIHRQAKLDAAGIGANAEVEDPKPAPERENIESIEIPLQDGRVIEYGPPAGISLSDRIARLYSGRPATDGGPDPGLTEYRLTRLLMGVRSIDGQPVAVNNLIDRTKLANRLGDQAIDLLNLFDSRHWPPLMESELPAIKKNLRQS